jgi:hypothetical protein
VPGFFGPAEKKNPTLPNAESLIAQNHYNKQLKSGKLVETEILGSNFLSKCVDWRKSENG